MCRRTRAGTLLVVEDVAQRTADARAIGGQRGHGVGRADADWAAVDQGMEVGAIPQTPGGAAGGGYYAGIHDRRAGGAAFRCPDRRRWPAPGRPARDGPGEGSAAARLIHSGVIRFAHRSRSARRRRSVGFGLSIHSRASASRIRRDGECIARSLPGWRSGRRLDFLQSLFQQIRICGGPRQFVDFGAHFRMRAADQLLELRSEIVTSRFAKQGERIGRLPRMVAGGRLFRAAPGSRGLPR